MWPKHPVTYSLATFYAQKFFYNDVVVLRLLSSCTQDLPKLKYLDLSHNEIAFVSDLHRKIGNLSKLILAFNQIATLEGKYNCRHM